MSGKDDRYLANRKNKRHRTSKSQQQQQQKNSTEKSTQNSGKSSLAKDDQSAATLIEKSQHNIADKTQDPLTSFNFTKTQKLVQTRNYDLSTDEETEEVATLQNNAANFNTLANQPTSVCEYFLFGAEKNWSAEAANSNVITTTTTTTMNADIPATQNYLIINKKLINCLVKAVPLYKLMKLDSTLFNTQQILMMEAAATAAKTNYDLLLQQQNILNANVKFNLKVNAAKQQQHNSIHNQQKQQEQQHQQKIDKKVKQKKDKKLQTFVDELDELEELEELFAETLNAQISKKNERFENVQKTSKDVDKNECILNVQGNKNEEISKNSKILMQNTSTTTPIVSKTSNVATKIETSNAVQIDDFSKWLDSVLDDDDDDDDT